MNLTEYKHALKSLLVENPNDALSELQGDVFEHSAVYDELILYSAQIRDVEMQYRKGIVKEDQLNILQNRIRVGILGLINRISLDDLKLVSSLNPENKESNSEKILEALESKFDNQFDEIIRAIKSLSDKIESLIEFNDKASNEVIDVDNFVDECYRLISFNKIRELLTLQKEYFLNDTEKLHAILLLSNRWAKNEEEKRLGQIENEKYTQENNKIIKANLDIIEEEKPRKRAANKG